ncbi:chitin-binding protein [Cohnella sp. SGD-V74]|uniref:lytic polysaccharide monooxygenase n=1 Tax=unclassified Cohnella TaxID=2636738 RepID=UPI000D4D52B3|nr:chitin-binding protein [Cohnella sp. SGD-V74]
MMKQVRLDSARWFKLLVAAGGMVIAFALSAWLADSASAHGYVDSPSSRAILCKNNVNTDCGAIVYEPQSLEAPKGWPNAGPADGKIASAGGVFPKLDEQSATRWAKVNVTPGPTTFTWKLTAAHSTASWKYYITKPDWDPNAPLSRASFDLTPFCNLPYSGQPPFTFSHTCDIPVRTGYHVILAVWEIADTANAFYNVIDVNFAGPADTIPPTAPTNLAVTNETSSTVSIAWTAATDNVGVNEYRIYRNGALVGTVNGATTAYQDTGLAANTSYSYKVVARDLAGNSSPDSNTAAATTTPPVPDTQAPTAPAGLHDMGVTATSVSLMWGPATDNVGVSEYRIYNGSTLVDTVNGSTLTYNVTGLSPNTAYTFTVYAADEAGNVSPASNAHTATTSDTVTCPAPWSSSQVYVNGDQVTYNGKKYQAKWWTLNERPDLRSGQWDVWQLLGDCP